MAQGRATVSRVAPRSPEHAAFGRALRILRARYGLTQETVALRSGIDRSYLGGVERGERNVTFSTLVRLARAFNLKGSELLKTAEDEQDRMVAPGGGGEPDAGN